MATGDDPVVDFTFTNRTRWPIKAFKGWVIAYNSFGDELLDGSIEEYVSIPPGQSIELRRSYHINIFEERHDRMARTPTSEMSADAAATEVQFADGSIVH